MKKENRKIIVGVVAVVILVGMVIFMNNYNNINSNKAEDLHIYKVYQYVKVEGYEYSNPLDSMTQKELLANPIPVKMDGVQGLYLKAMAYTFFTGQQVDYLDIQELMNTGQPLEVYSKYEEYIDWISLQSRNTIMGYQNALVAVGSSHGISIGANADYNKYKEIIETWPDEIKENFEEAKANEKRES